ncbi:MAG TPA: heavy metal-associated domain-containing protein, partial [Bacteroidia bacterium]|nr:heavy metal-associated domain-containing protein [Bacteroidia bacterium]
MKNFKTVFILTFLFSLFTGMNVNAQAVAKTETIKIVTSAECDMCKKKIETEVGKMKGVKKAELDLATKTLTVEYNTKKTSPEKIRKLISDIGYDADDIKANNRANKNLQHCPAPQTDS